jgi:hypothetical protein
MATTTTNFGWDIPQSTDLVKDGATAIAALGQDIDTALVDLKGGTTGQILTKASNTDLDYTWSNANPGDITAVTAGTGISGGGTSGDVTITNSMATAIDAKGDLIGGTGADTFTRLAVGTDGQVLTADSTASTGLKWASSGSSFSGVLVGNTASQNIPNNTATAITWATETFDTDAFHSTSSNTSRITIPSGKAGYYLVGGQVEINANTSGFRTLSLYKNGSPYKRVTITPSGLEPTMVITVPINLAVGDYVELYFTQNSGGSIVVYTNGEDGSFYANYLGA